MQMICKWASH